MLQTFGKNVGAICLSSASYGFFSNLQETRPMVSNQGKSMGESAVPVFSYMKMGMQERYSMWMWRNMGRGAGISMQRAENSE